MSTNLFCIQVHRYFLVQCFLSERIGGNVCVSAVVRFRSRVLSHETKRGTKIKTYSLYLTAPLQKHFVGSSRALLLTPFVAQSFVSRQLTPIFFSKSCGGAFFIAHFLRLHYTEHTLCLALDVGCKCGLAMCVRFSWCHLTRTYNTICFL